MDELIVIPFSHFCEKARWGLERIGHPFRETGAMPVLHLRVAKRAMAGAPRRKEKHASPYAVPILVTPEGPVAGSTAILDHADPAFCGGEKTRALIADFDDRLGPHTRRVAYYLVFTTPGAFGALVRHNAPWWQRPLALAAPLVVGRMQRAMRIDREGFERSRARVDEVLDEVDQRLADGRPYLEGDEFGAADLAFAALLAPVLLPPEYGAWLPPVERFGPEGRGLVEGIRTRPSGRHALRVYREHRR